MTEEMIKRYNYNEEHNIKPNLWERFQIWRENAGFRAWLEENTEIVHYVDRPPFRRFKEKQ